MLATQRWQRDLARLLKNRVVVVNTRRLCRTLNRPKALAALRKGSKVLEDPARSVRPLSRESAIDHEVMPSHDQMTSDHYGVPRKSSAGSDSGVRAGDELLSG